MSAVGTAWVSTAPAQFLFYFTDFPSPFGQNSMNSYKSYRGPGVRYMPLPILSQGGPRAPPSQGPLSLLPSVPFPCSYVLFVEHTSPRGTRRAAGPICKAGLGQQVHRWLPCTSCAGWRWGVTGRAWANGAARAPVQETQKHHHLSRVPCSWAG